MKVCRKIGDLHPTELGRFDVSNSSSEAQRASGHAAIVESARPHSHTTRVRRGSSFALVIQPNRYSAVRGGIVDSRSHLDFVSIFGVAFATLTILGIEDANKSNELHHIECRDASWALDKSSIERHPSLKLYQHKVPGPDTTESSTSNTTPFVMIEPNRIMIAVRATGNREPSFRF